MSFEYASGWHKHLFLRRPLTEAEKLETEKSSLRYFSSQMSTYGYDTYLINAGGKDIGVVLIPVSMVFFGTTILRFASTGTRCTVAMANGAGTTS